MKKISIAIVLMIFIACVTLPKTAEEWLEKGQVAYQAKNYDEAVKCFKKAIALNPNHAKAHYNLDIMYDSKGLLDKAISEYKQALIIDPNFAEARNNLWTGYDMI